MSVHLSNFLAHGHGISNFEFKKWLRIFPSVKIELWTEVMKLEICFTKQQNELW